MSALNKKLPFNEVWGGQFPWKFEQNGKRYLMDGSEYVEDGAGQPTAAPAPGPVPPSPNEQSEAAIRAANEEAERAASSAALAQRQAVLQMEAFKLLDKGAEKVIGELEDLVEDILPVLLAVESQVKNRKTVVEAINAQIKARADAAAAEAAKAGQVTAQLQ
jgi:hypothetical protein